MTVLKGGTEKDRFLNCCFVNKTPHSLVNAFSNGNVGNVRLHLSVDVTGLNVSRPIPGGAIVPLIES